MGRNITIPQDFTPKGSRWSFIKITQKRNWRLGIPEKALYKCICGTIKDVFTGGVKSGVSKSCGCYNIEKTIERGTKHGLYYHPAYRVWSKVKTRCYDSKAKEYPNYGGRGVVMCDEWKNNPKSFVEWCLANGWRRGLDIDKDILAERIGVEPLLYSPERCLFVTRKENLNNKRDNVRITFNGITKNITQWAEEIGMNRSSLRYRIQRSKWPIEKALTTPVNSSKIKNN